MKNLTDWTSYTVSDLPNEEKCDDECSEPKVRLNIQWRGVKYYPSKDDLIKELRSEIALNKRAMDTTKSYSIRSRGSRPQTKSNISTVSGKLPSMKSLKSGRRRSKTIFVTIAKRSNSPQISKTGTHSTSSEIGESFPDMYSYESDVSSIKEDKCKQQQPDMENFDWLSMKEDYESEMLRGVSVSQDYSRVVSHIAGNQYFQAKTFSKYKSFTNKYSELKDLPRPEALMKALLKEKFLHQPYDTENIEWVRELYTNAIIKHSGLYRILLRCPEIISGEAAELMKEAKKIDHVEVEEGLPLMFDDITDWDRAFFTSLYSHAKNVHDEMEMEIRDFDSFFSPLFSTKHEKIDLDKDFVNIKSPSSIRMMISELSDEIHEVREYPGNNIFRFLLSLLKACEHNSVLLTEMSRCFDQWLDQLIKCLFSPYHSVKVSASCVIAYIFTLPQLAASLRCNRYNDIIFDIVSSIIRAMDMNTQHFSLYFSILSYIMDEYPTHSVIDSISQKVSQCRCIPLHQKWPLILYFAFRHWSMDKFITSELYIQRMMDLLETAFSKPLSRKTAKKALAQLSKRYQIRPNLITHWPGNEQS